MGDTWGSTITEKLSDLETRALEIEAEINQLPRGHLRDALGGRYNKTMNRKVF